MGENELLRILFVEDLVIDMELAVRELKYSGIRFNYTRVETKDAFLAALDDFRPEIIISDYSMPLFDGMQALKLSLGHDPMIPFIILTGSMNEDTAVACLKAGATDYVIKEHLVRLPYAVKEAMDHCRVIKEKEATDRALRESELNYRTLADSGHALIWTSGTDKGYNYFNKPWLEFTGRTLDQELDFGWTEDVHPDDLMRCQEIYDNAFRERLSFSREYRLRRYDGMYRWIWDDGKSRYNNDGDFIGYIGHCLDITAHKEAEEQVLHSLEEKEVMLMEIHHRVKNNMQLICSLLELQDMCITDKNVKIIFEESLNRVKSMAMVHEKLYLENDLSLIDFKEYLQSLIGNIADTYMRDDIEFLMTVDENMALNVNAGIPCGLIINELVSNSLKHAFPEGRTGSIRLSFGKNNEENYMLTVADNGIGFPAGLDFYNTSSLGLHLVKVLVGQLSGTIELSKSDGTGFRITFPSSPNTLA